MNGAGLGGALVSLVRDLDPALMQLIAVACYSRAVAGSAVWTSETGRAGATRRPPRRRRGHTYVFRSGGRAARAPYRGAAPPGK